MEIPPTISMPTAIFKKIYIDIMKMPLSGKYSMIVAARDDLSGFCEAKALTAQTSQQLANFFWIYIYCRYGCPQQVTTDNGSEVKKAFEILMKRLGIPQVTITAYNKHANGVVERGHFTLREAIVKACQGHISRWPQILPVAVFADRVTVSSVTGYSPFQLLHATLPVLPFDLAESTFLVDGFYAGMTTSELLALRIRQLQKHPKDIERAAQTLRNSRFKSKLQFEKRFKRKLRREDYKPGELVLLRNVKLETSVASESKTDDRYLGPYEVQRKNRGGAYILQELDGSVLKNGPVAAFRLLPYITRDHWFMRTGWMGPEPNDDDSEDSTDSEELSETSTGD
jgi:transposase InsO family protein